MEITITTATYEGIEQDFITIHLDENSAQTFPADESNPDYVAWLETADGKAYLASQKASK